MEPTRNEPEFYIASRLRGIPLVTEQQQQQSHKQADQQSTSARPKRQNHSNHPQAGQISVSVNGKKLNNQAMQHQKQTKPTTRNPHELMDAHTLRDLMMKEVDKRQVNEPVSLLFKPSASTASVRNRKSSSTTTTTRKPKITTTRKISQQQSQGNARLQQKTTTTTTTTPSTTTSSPTTTTTSTTTTTTTTSTTKRPQLASTTISGSGFREVRTNMKEEHASPLTTRQAPDYQQQRATGSRHQMTNNRFVQEPSAGRNWILFNKGDGSFSMFELAVLISNVAIVGTIIFVILFTWIKAINKRRESTKSGSGNKANASGGDVESKGTNVETISARYSSMGDGQSAGGHPSAGNTPAPSRFSSMMSDTKPKSLTDEPGTTTIKNNNTNKRNQPGEQQPIDRAASEASTLPSRAPPIVNKNAPAVNDQSAAAAKSPSVVAKNQVAEEGMNVAKSQQATVTNKAMAIVQPTENQATTLSNDVMNSSMTVKSNKDNKPNGATAEQPGAMSEPGSAKLGLDKQPKGGQAIAPPPRDGLLSPADSLQSIELPESLVQSIKRVEQATVTNATAEAEPKPSPNMLLGEPDNVAINKQQPTGSLAGDILNKFAKEVKDEASKLMTIEAKIEPPPQTTKPGPNKSTPTVAADPKLAGDLQQKAPTTKQQDSKKLSDKSVASSQGQNKEMSNEEANKSARPQNPTGRDSVNERGGLPKQSPNDAKGDDSRIKNHQVVINKLDKRKTTLEIVDIRDESVTGKMGSSSGGAPSGGDKQQQQNQATSPSADELGQHWISMDGVAVTQSNSSNTTSKSAKQQGAIGTQSSGIQAGAATDLKQQMTGLNQAVSETQIMSPSEIIGNRFSVDYRAQSGASQQEGSSSGGVTTVMNKNDSMEEGGVNIDKEVEEDNQMKNRKYFVYIVHDGHFSAKKECIARIELPAKRRISLADVRQLIASSPDISLNSLRRNRFKFVTETYRLLNEDEDAANLHQVYPTQGVFLKLNVDQQVESLSYPAQRGRSRLSSTGINSQQQLSNNSNTRSSNNYATSSSTGRSGNLIRRPMRPTSDSTNPLPAIQLNDRSATRPRGRSSGPARANRQPGLTRSKSGLDSRSLNKSSGGSTSNTRNRALAANERDKNKSLSSTALGRFIDERIPTGSSGFSALGLGSQAPPSSSSSSSSSNKQQQQAAGSSSFGDDVISGAKRLFNAIVT